MVPAASHRSPESPTALCSRRQSHAGFPDSACSARM